MKVTDLSIQATRFIGDNLELFSEAARICGQWAIEVIEIDGRLNVLLNITRESIGHDEIRRVAPIAIELRDRLLKLQGHDPHPFLANLDRDHKAGRYSYAKIAKRINDTVAEDVIMYASYEAEFEAAQPTLKNYGDFILWLDADANGPIFEELKRMHRYLALQRARDILTAIGIKDSEAGEALESGLQRARRGQRPIFEKEFPVSRGRVLLTLKNWRRNNPQEG